MQSVYELKQFKSAKHPGLLDALKLYVAYTEPALRTDNKEIMYCLDNWNKDYEDRFFVVGYGRWHNLFVGQVEKEKYAAEINSLIQKMTKQLANKQNIDINGLSGLFTVKTNVDEGGQGKKVLKVFTGLVLFTVSFALVGLFFTYIKVKFGWDTNTATTVITIATGLTLFVVALLFENSSQLFSRTLAKVLDRL